MQSDWIRKNVFKCVFFESEKFCKIHIRYRKIINYYIVKNAYTHYYYFCTLYSYELTLKQFPFKKQQLLIYCFILE